MTTEKSPREIYPDLKVIQGGQSRGPASPGGGDTGGEGPDLRPVWCSDDGLAALLSARFADDWLYAAGSWYVYTNGRYLRDETKRDLHESRHVCRGVASEIIDLKIAARVSSDHAIYAAAKIAATDRRHARRLDQFDADSWLLNTPHGIVDLRTGQLLPHDRAAMMTRLTRASPALGGPDCPRWLQFIEEITEGDTAVARYLQRIAGYCLTGSVEEHAIFFLYGPKGGNGKSVFQTILVEMLGDYGTTAMMDLFVVATGERHSTELAALAGQRLVIASETDEGRRWDEAKLKAITGGDTITARKMRGDPFTFRPSFKLILAGNHRPRMRSADGGMRRRMQVIPFRHKPAKPDKALAEKLKAEIDDILTWAIEGEMERRRIGLAPPPAILRETEEYFDAEDVLGRWIEERCVRGVDKRDPINRLYADFKSWAVRDGEYVLSKRGFAQKLRLVEGIEPVYVDRGKGVRGIALAFAEAELPGLREVRPAVVRANDTPIESASDPAEHWPRG